VDTSIRSVNVSLISDILASFHVWPCDLRLWQGVASVRKRLSRQRPYRARSSIGRVQLPASVAKVVDSVPGRAAAIRQELKDMEASGVVWSARGPRNSTLWTLSPVPAPPSS
jgi:hypothetical protein